MKIHEYQAKELLAQAGAPVVPGIVASNVEEAVSAFDRLGGHRAVLKAQIHAGGRGKGRFAGSDRPYGGVQLVQSREECRDVAATMFRYPLVTRQTGPAGQPVRKVLVQEAVDIAREVYLGAVVDRGRGCPVLMACAEGGVEIEEVAARSPESILRVPFWPDQGLPLFQARRLAFELGFLGEQVSQAEQLIRALARLFIEKDCSLAEINPVVVTTDGRVLALDAKVNFDDNALFRHPEIEALRDVGEEDPREWRAKQAGLSYVSMTGNIGCLVNGAGLAMATMDIIKLHGGEPANFLDVGGGASQEQVTEGFRILLSDPNVRAVLVNIFGGIMKCDVIAAAIIAAAKEVGFRVPLVVRLEGTNVELGRKLLAESGLNIIPATDLADAARKAVAAANATHSERAELIVGQRS
ncbi:MAG: ADP-forming succinate--CoA ligase subunit beta [Gemmatales bacterium]|nr:ADP-forming succinate--CoA ligase subunit beta [Gemmatales bacterium]MDW7993378.1 ADP-forming succinate--CoA ligase subunit beta [Gemmatales bacterium]